MSPPSPKQMAVKREPRHRPRRLCDLHPVLGRRCVGVGMIKVVPNRRRTAEIEKIRRELRASVRKREIKAIQDSRTPADVDATMEHAIEVALDARQQLVRGDLLAAHLTPAQIEARMKICLARVLERRPDFKELFATP